MSFNFNLTEPYDWLETRAMYSHQSEQTFFYVRVSFAHTKCVMTHNAGNSLYENSHFVTRPFSSLHVVVQL